MTKIDKYAVIANFNSEPTCKLINKIPGLRLFISSLQGSAPRTRVEESLVIQQTFSKLSGKTLN